MSLANLSASYTRMREALESVAYVPGEWKEIQHIQYCRWCNWSKDWIAKNAHAESCPVRGGTVNG